MTFNSSHYSKCPLCFTRHESYPINCAMNIEKLYRAKKAKIEIYNEMNEYLKGMEVLIAETSPRTKEHKFK